MFPSEKKGFFKKKLLGFYGILLCLPLSVFSFRQPGPPLQQFDKPPDERPRERRTGGQRSRQDRPGFGLLNGTHFTLKSFFKSTFTYCVQEMLLFPRGLRDWKRYSRDFLALACQNLAPAAGGGQDSGGGGREKLGETCGKGTSVGSVLHFLGLLILGKRTLM